MKVLLIGPYPPPHGGISVHVVEAAKYLRSAGVEVRVLNTDRRALSSPDCLSFRDGFDFARIVAQHARSGWTLHLHINGHNDKSWLLAFTCGLIGQWGPGAVLTIHSGMAPSYLQGASRARRILARTACSLYSRIIGVNQKILSALAALGVSAERLELLPAYIGLPMLAALPSDMETFLWCHKPVVTSVLFYRPEYGFRLLVEAVVALRRQYPSLGCFVLGSGEERAEAERLVAHQGLSDDVLLLGDVPHDLCLALMAQSDAFLRCTFADGDAISVREAIGLGVPVIASDVGFRPPGARLFPAGDLDALVSATQDILGRALGPPAHSRAGSDSDAAAFHRLLEMYEQVAA